MSELLRKFIRELETGRASPAEQYDTIIGHHEGKLAKPLTAHTLDEVLAKQDLWRKAFGTTSGAVGAYQFIKPTLASLKKELGLSGQEKFDSGLQDKLCDRLLSKRGLAKFLAGELGRDAFGNSLAKEWASFPLLAGTKRGQIGLRRGQSYYDGVAGNSALCKPAAVESLLDQVKGAKLGSKPNSNTGALPSKGSMKMSETVNVPVKSAWASKVNWAMALGIIFNIFAFFGLDVPDDVRAAVLAGGGSLVLVGGWIARTFFTTAITSASASKIK